MKNQISKTNKSQIALMDDKQLSDIIKPLSNEIHLFDTFVSGTLNLKDKSVLEEIRINDKLILKRDEKIYDDNNINIYVENGRKIGCLPEKDNAVFARLMDAGKLLIARVKEIKTQSTIPVVSIGIYLIDY